MSKILRSIFTRREEPRQGVHPLVDKPIIAVLPMWRNPIIGFCEDQVDGKLIIDDYLGEELAEGTRIDDQCRGVFHFTEQRYQLIVKTDPFEIASIIYPELCFDKEFRTEKKIFLLTPEQINQTLRENGFWEDLTKYRQKLYRS